MMTTAFQAMPLAVLWGWVATAVGAGSVPIVIHLLNRFRFRRVSWAAMDFLLRALEKNRRRLRTENLLLLLIRVLMVMLFALALANITFSCDNRSGILAGQPRLRVVMVDDSFSSGYRLGNTETILDRSKTTALGLLEGLSTQDRAYVMRVNDRGVPLQDRPLSLQQEYTRLVNNNFTMPSHRGTNYCLALEEAFGMLKELEGDDAEVIPEIVILGDMQRSGFLREGKLLSEEFVNVARTLDYPEMKVYLQPFGPEKPENVAVVRMETGQTNVVAVDMRARFEATVVNYGNETLDRVQANLHVNDPSLADDTGGVVKSVQIESLPPMSPRKVVFDYTFRRLGNYEVKVTVDVQNDYLALDDSRYLAVPVSEGTRILIVDGYPFDDSAFLLKKTFLPEVERSGIEAKMRIFETVPEIVDIDRFDRDTFSLRPYQVVILSNVRELSTSRLQRLRTYVEEGGQVMVFPGAQIDRDWYNTFFYNEGKGLLPARLGPETVAMGAGIDDGRDFVGLERTDAGHPTVAWMRELGFNWRLAQIYRYYQLDVPMMAGAAPVDEEADTASAEDEPAGDDAPAKPPTVLATLSGSSKLPAIVEKRFGVDDKGHVVLFAFPAGGQWSNLPRTITHPLFMFRLVEDLIEPPIDSLNLSMDEPLVRKLEVGEFDRVVTIADPLDELTELRPSRDADQGMATLDFRRTHRAGFYTLKPDVARKAEVFAVNVERQIRGDEPISGESDLRKIDIEELRELASGVDFQWHEDPKTLNATLSEAGQSSTLFRQLLYAVLGLTLLESLLAWRFGRFK